MRPRVPALLLSIALPAAVLAAPVVSTSTPAKPRPISPVVAETTPGFAALPASPPNAGGPRAEGAVGAAETAPASRGIREAAVVTRAQGFQMVALRWAKDSLPADVALQVRVQAVGGAWADWIDVEPLDSGPDAGDLEDRPSTLTDSEPIWVGDVTAVQARAVDAAGSGRVPADLRIVTINAGRSPADSAVGVTPLSSAAAVATRPTVLSRAQWGADESLRQVNAGCDPIRYTGALKVGFVHHTASANGYSAADAPAAIRGIYAFSVYSRGYCDVPYNFIVDRFGRTWEGRAGGIDKPVLSAATGGFNTNTFAVSALGNYEDVDAPPAMQDAIAQVVAWKLGLHGVNVWATAQLTSAGGGTSRYAAGEVVSFNVMSGHRDAGSTACPGAFLYPRLPWMRWQAGQYQASGASLVTTTAPRQGIRVAYPLSGLEWWAVRAVDLDTQRVLRTWSGRQSSPVDVTWDLTDGNGATVPTGHYGLALTTESASLLWGAWVSHQGPTAPQYPVGAILGVGPWVWQVGDSAAGPVARPFYSAAALQSLPGAPTRVIQVPLSAVLALPPGPPASYREGALIKGVNTPEVYVVSDGVLRQLTRDAFVGPLGYRWDLIQTLPDAEISLLPKGPLLPWGSALHPAGAYVKTASAVYALAATTSGQLVRRLVASPLAMNLLSPWGNVLPATAGDLALPLDPYLRGVPDGTVLAVAGGPAVASRGLPRKVQPSSGLTLPVALPGSTTDFGRPASGLVYGPDVASTPVTTSLVLVSPDSVVDPLASWTWASPGSADTTPQSDPPRP